MAAVAALILPATSRSGEPSGGEVPEEVWDRPRSGRMLLGVPAVRRALAALAADGQSRLIVRHGPGTDAAAQAEELKAWMVAHAVEPDRIEIRADRAARQPLLLDVTTQFKPRGAP